MDWYRGVLRPVLFGSPLEPEFLHERSLDVFRWLDQQREFPVGRWWLDRLERSLCLHDPRLSQTLWGLTFPHPLGLAAGFDKNGVAAGAWRTLGFGFTELGTVTQHPQPGNPQPRLFRLAADRAVLNRMGFNNAGADALADRLAAQRSDPHSRLTIPVGINLGKSKITPLDAAPADYAYSFARLRDWGDYFVINVSSPNTPGLRSLQGSEQLGQIIDALQQINQGERPILVKIAPDLEWEAIAEVIELVQKMGLAGIIATNTTIRRDGLQTQTLKRTGQAIATEAGGISGAPLRSQSTEVIRFIYRHTGGTLPIMGVGGVFSAADAWEKITAGASLVQTYTGWVFEGPGMGKRVAIGLLEHLAAAGLTHLSEAVGIAAHGDSASGLPGSPSR